VNTAACIVVRRPDLERLLATIRSIAPQVHEVVVVVDAGSDMLAVARVLRGIAAVVPVPRGTGAGAAANRGVRLLVDRGAEAVVRLDQHDVAPDGLVEDLVQRFEDPRVGIAVGVLGPVGAVRVPAGAAGLVPRDVDACATSGSVVRADVWQQIGGWDEELAADHLEYDLCLRVRQSGSVVVQDPAVVIARPVPTPAADDALALADCAHDSVWFARKHRGIPVSVRVAGRSVPATYGAIVARAVRIAVDGRVHDRSGRVGALLRGALAGAAVRRHPQPTGVLAAAADRRRVRSDSAA
jgi:rhamnosyltransferase